MVDLLCARIGEINRRPLRDLLFAFLEHYGVPLNGIQNDEISALVQVRNSLVHGGEFRRSPEASRLTDHLLLLQELLRRIFLSLLGYSGHRSSFLNGEQWEEFPPKKS